MRKPFFKKIKGQTLSKIKLIFSHEPFRWLIYRIKIIIIWFKHLGNNPLYAPGVHLLDAPSGTGKTLLANIIIQNSTSANQFWYTNIDQFEEEKQQVFEVSSLFEKGKQIAKLPTFVDGKWAQGIIFDELNLNFNRRMNKTTDYNNLFIGLMELVVSHRHQHMNKLYFLSQDLSFNDKQIQNAFKYHHIIYSKKRYNYKIYKDNYNKKLVKTPKKLLVDHYIKTAEKTADGTTIFTKFKTSKIKVDTLKHLYTYNHLGYAKKYEDLPEVKI